jgi:hypothetical protein
VTASVQASGRYRMAAGFVPLLLAAAAAVPGPHGRAAAQTVDDELAILRLEATPIGALPPISPPMPASRNHNYWGIRLQAGQRNGRAGADLRSIGGGIDLQWRGGSIFGATAGYQTRDCDVAADGDCGGHALFGLRGRFNVMTGGPGLASDFDYSATSILGAEMGFGFAPDVLEGRNACTFDIGVPVALAMFQKVRVVPFLTPSIVWDVTCSRNGPPTRASYLVSLGVGVQQLWLRGLDAYLGFQKIFRSDTGYHFGISITYIRLP